MLVETDRLCWRCGDAVLGDASWVAQTSVICQNPKVTAINTGIEVDLTGQVCADSMGTRMYTGTTQILKFKDINSMKQEFQ